MTGSENLEWLAVIDDMQAYAKLLPDDPMWSVGVAQTLADVIVELEPHLTREQRSVLIGVGAVIVERGEKETGAWLQAATGLGIVRSVRRDGGAA